MNNPAPALRDVQDLFFRLLLAPEGVEKGIAELEAAGEPAGARVDAWIDGDERLDARGRLDVYANMYFFRIRDAVAEDFPALVALIGPAKWHNLMTDYLLAHPSRHWSLRWVGERIPEFLATHPLATERPDLSDLAGLEFALADVFQQVDAPAFPAEALAAVPPESWPGLRFSAAPSVRLLDLAHRVGPLRDALAPDLDPEDERERSEAPDPDATPGTVLIWRGGHAARHEALEEPGAGALRALLSGESFGEVCDRLAGATGDEGAAASSAAELLSTALSRGLLAGFSVENP